MKLPRQNGIVFGAGRRRTASGLTMIEMVVASAVGALVLLVVSVLSVYAMRSFATLGNYAILDARNRTAMDKVMRDLREASLIFVDRSNNRLIFTNAFEGTKFSYIWFPEERKLICDRGETEETYLTECDEWNVAFFQRTPLLNAPNSFLPATTNSDGHVDVQNCKLIEMNWKCSRTVLGKKLNTEAVQNVRVMLRNQN